MSRTMNSQALVLLDRMLGLSGPGGEQYTTLDDGNVQQVLEISEVARRSLTPAGSSGYYTFNMQSHHSAILLINQLQDPYNLSEEITLGVADINGWPVPVGRGFDIWLIGASIYTDKVADADWALLQLNVPSRYMALSSHQSNMAPPSQNANDTARIILGRWDTWEADDSESGVVAIHAGLTENGSTYLPINQRLVRGTTIQLSTLATTYANNVRYYMDYILGIFPEGLGQDIAT